MILRGTHLFLVCGAALVALISPAITHAETAVDLDRQLAREPAELTTTAGRTVRGILDGFRDGRLHLRLATDGGEVGYSFAPAEIARLTLPGAEMESDAFELLERSEVAQAMPLLEALGRQRIRYLPILDEARQQVLWKAAVHGGTSGDPHTIRAIVRAMALIADTAGKRVILLEAELEIALRLRDADEVRELATRWCAAADPAGPSALGWRVLARAAYEATDYERARWLALQPVTFAAQPDMRDLDLCYALAITTADHQGDVAHARILHRAMCARDIAWPTDPAFAAIGAHYTRAPDGPEQPLSSSHLTPPPSRETATTPSLDQICKLPHPSPEP